MTILALAFLLAAQPAQSTTPPVGQRTVSPQQILAGAGLGPDAPPEDADVAAAAAFPLGSRENPVRVGGPLGERDYLARLRCADGSTPAVGPRAEGGVGGFGSLVSAYTLACGAARTTLLIDIYHEEHREDRAPPGFTMAGR